MFCSSLIAVGLHIGSYHTADNEKYNNNNPGIYVAYEGYTAGTYRNSHNRNTVYAGKTWNISEDCKYEITTGLATGYNIKGASVVPLVAASVKFNPVGQSVVRVSVIPQVSSNAKLEGVVLHVSTELFRF